MMLAQMGCFTQLVMWSQTDILAIRSLSCMALSMFICYDFCHSMWVYVGWEILYFIMNLYLIIQILRERANIELTATEQTLWDSIFKDYLTKKQLRELLALGEETSVAGGTVL